MPTTAPLSPQEQDILQACLLAPMRSKRRAWLWCALLLVAAGAFLLAMACSLKIFDFILLAIPSAVILAGFKMLHSALGMHRRERALHRRLAGLEKRIFSGPLKQLDIVDRKRLRYLIGDEPIEVYLPDAGNVLDSERLHPLKTAAAWLEQPLDLHVAEVEAGQHVLLAAVYRHACARSTMSLKPADRKAIMNRTIGQAIMLVLAMTCLIGLLTWIFGTGDGPLTGAMITSATVLFGVGIVLAMRVRETESGKRKLRIETTVMERVELTTGSGKYSTDECWYRLGDGSLLETDLEKLEPGERVTIEQMLDDKNRPGLVIRIGREPAAMPAAA